MDALDCVALLCPLIQDPISLGGKEAVVFAILKRAGKNLSIPFTIYGPYLALCKPRIGRNLAL